MSDAVIESQSKRINQLDAEAAKYRRRANEYKEKLAEAEKKMEGHAKALDDFAKKIEAADKRAADAAQALADAPNKFKAENEQFKAREVARSRKDALHKVGKDKIRADAMDDALGFLAWEDGDIDEAKLAEAVDGLISQKPYLKASQDAASESGGSGQSVRGGSAQSGATLKPAGPGFGRGPAPTGSRGIDDELALRYPDPSKIA